jgi:hypothetical protein
MIGLILMQDLHGDNRTADFLNIGYMYLNLFDDKFEIDGGLIDFENKVWGTHGELEDDVGEGRGYSSSLNPSGG